MINDENDSSSFGAEYIHSTEPVYFEELKQMWDYCRLRYSELMGKVCVIDTGGEGSSSGTTSIEHHLDNEFAMMVDFQHQLNVENPLRKEHDYPKMISVLLKAMYAYHRFVGVKPIFNYAFDWPPKECINEPLLDKEGVKVVLLDAINTVYSYLVANKVKDLDRSLVCDYNKPMPNGIYDWVSFEPII